MSSRPTAAALAALAALLFPIGSLAQRAPVPPAAPGEAPPPDAGAAAGIVPPANLPAPLGAPLGFGSQQIVAPPVQETRATRFSPSIRIGETYSDNVGLEPEPLATRGWITTVTPGLSYQHTGAHSRIAIDYRYESSFYSNRSELNEGQNYLNAFVNLELMERWFFLEGLGSITQINRNAFEAPVVVGAPNTTANANRVETRTGTISPIFRGRVWDAAIWQVRYNETAVRTDERGFSRLHTSELLGTIRTATPSARIGWAVDAFGLRSRTDLTGALEDKRVRASLIFGVTPQLHLSAIAGYEVTDFASTGEDRGATPGAGIEWSPSERTQLAGVVEHRFFGTGYSVQFSHRTPLTAWRLGTRRESTLLSSVLGSNANSVDQLMRDLLIAAIPDPAARSEAARERVRELGSAPTTIGSSFLTERPFLVESVDGSAALLGRRNSITLAFSVSEQHPLVSRQDLTDSFTLGGDIRQRSFTGSWRYRLTPLTNLTLSGSSLRTWGLLSGAPSSREELGTIFLSTQLGRRTTATLGYRHVDFSSTTASNYRENAIFGSLTFRL